MESTAIIVEFWKYCPKCKWHNKRDYEYPCNECMEHGSNDDSEKPVLFEKKGKKRY